MALEEGETVPGFRLEDQEGREVSSEDLDNAVIYFYPKADTPGCTKEACGFRDSMDRLEQAGVAVYGVSTDTVDEVREFHEKYGLNFTLLADPGGKVSEKFGVLGDSGHAERTTFVVRDGSIEKVFRKVDPGDHVEELLTYLGS